jgi:NAD+ synthase
VSQRLNLALASLNPHLGALPGNASGILAARAQAASLGAELLLTPQASLCGHPVLDLARDAGFRAACDAAVAGLAAATADGGPAVLVGAPALEAGALHDTTFLLGEGRILARRARHAVPERESPFHPGPAPGPVAYRGIRLGLMTGADFGDSSVAETLAESGAELLLCPAAMPAGVADAAPEIDLAVARVVETGLPLAWVGQLGGQDEDVFAGGGFVLNADRSLALRLPIAAGALSVTSWRRGAEGWHCDPQPLPAALTGDDRLWRLLSLGLADHVAKNGFAHAAVPLTGGVGPELVLALAADALGPGRVRALVPEHASPGAATRLGIAWERVLTIAAPGCGAPEATRRLRDAIMLSLAESQDALLLPGFDRTAWLLGETLAPGGFAPLKGLYASELPALARWRGIGVSEPDSATDAILEALTDHGQTPGAVAARGFDPSMVSALWRRVHRGGYKRQQASPGMTLGRWRDRHAPLTHGFTDPAS